MDVYVLIPIFEPFLNLLLVIYGCQYRVDVNIRNKNGGTCLLVAADINDEITVNRLLEKGANVQLKDNDGNIALHRSVINGNFEISAAMVNSDYRTINIQNRDGVTPLMYAVLWDQARLAFALIDQGARLDLKDVYGRDVITYCDVYVRPAIKKYIKAKLGD